MLSLVAQPHGGSMLRAPHVLQGSECSTTKYISHCNFEWTHTFAALVHVNVHVAITVTSALFLQGPGTFLYELW